VFELHQERITFATKKMMINTNTNTNNAFYEASIKAKEEWVALKSNKIHINDNTNTTTTNNNDDANIQQEPIKKSMFNFSRG